MVDDDARLLPDMPVAAIADHIARGGGVGLERAITTNADDVVGILETAGLRGRGGAGFPTGAKWRSILEAASDGDTAIDVVVNAAEGEPGTYKDRALMENDPFVVVEGALVAAVTVGARSVQVCVKERAEAAADRMDQAVDEAVAQGWPFADRIEVVRGPDEYLYGEEKAMLEVIEGRLPMPRHLPPFAEGIMSTGTAPSVALVNNVETLANVPGILRHGPEWFRALGTDDTPGTLLCTVVGDVEAAGVYELPAGTPLRTLLVDLAGAEDIAFVLPGVSAGVITPLMLDTALDHTAMELAGTAIGSAGFVVYDHRHCVVRVTATLARFLAVESCGQCNACQLGTTAMSQALARIDAGEGTSTELDLLARVAERVTDLARCGLPAGAQLVIGSMLEQFTDAFVDHLGRACHAEADEVVPKIEHLDLTTGTVRFDDDYARKRSDWSYRPDDT